MGNKCLKESDFHARCQIQQHLSVRPKIIHPAASLPEDAWSSPVSWWAKTEHPCFWLLSVTTPCISRVHVWDATDRLFKPNDPDSVEGTEGDEEGIPWSFLLHCPRFLGHRLLQSEVGRFYWNNGFSFGPCALGTTTVAIVEVGILFVNLRK